MLTYNLRVASVASAPEHASAVASAPEHTSAEASAPEHASAVASAPEHASAEASAPEHASAVASAPEHASAVASAPEHFWRQQPRTELRSERFSSGWLRRRRFRSARFCVVCGWRLAWRAAFGELVVRGPCDKHHQA